MVHLWGLVLVLGGWGRALEGLSDAEKKEEDGVSLHGGMDETSLRLYLRPDLVSPGYREAPVVTGHSLQESFDAAKSAGWPGYLGSPRLASPGLGEKIWKSFASAAIEHARSVLDGADPGQFQRYADLGTYPALPGVDGRSRPRRTARSKGAQVARKEIA